MDPISLTLNSPRIPLAGLDDAIGKLERVETLLSGLQKQRGFSINLEILGTHSIDAATANINGLKSALREAGQSRMAEQLERGLITAGEVARTAQSEIRKLSAELQQATVKSVQMQGKFEELHSTSKGDLLNFVSQDKMSKLRNELNGAITEVETLQSKMAGLQRIQGFGEGVSGTPEPASRGAAAAGVAASGAMAASAAKQSEAASETVQAQREGLNITRQQLAEHQKLFQLTAQVAQKHQEINAPQLGVERIVNAYREITAESGKTAVSISDLQSRSGVALNTLQDWIRKQRTAGRAALIEGDWDAATDAMREAAMKALRPTAPGAKKQFASHMMVELNEPGMQRVGGPTVGLIEQTKNIAAMTEAARAAELLGAAEKKLVGPASESAAALGRQEDIVRSKIAAMGSLNGVTAKTAAEEKKLAVAAEEAAVAQERGGEVSRRILRDRKGAPKGESITFNQGPGDTLTTLPGGFTSQSINQLAKFRAEFADIKAQFTASRTAMSQAGFEKSSPEMLNLLGQEASARQLIVDKMAKAGVQGDALYKSEVLRVKALEESVARQQQVNSLRQSQGVQKDVGQALDMGFRDRAAMLDREYASQKKLGVSKQEEVAILRQQATAYRELSDAMRASGRGAQPQELGVRKRAQVMEARAGALEAEIFQDTRASVRSSIDTGFREHAAMLESEYATLKAGISTRQEEVALLRQQAAAYLQLADAMKASSRGGIGEIVTRGKAGTAGARATALENELAAEKQQIADMVNRFQTQVAGFGGRQTRSTSSQGPSGRTERTRSERDDPNGMRESIELTRRWNAAGEELVPTLNEASVAMKNVGRSATAAGKSMLDNLVTVTAWAAAVGILYKSLALLSFGAQSFAKLEYSAARLSAVFRGTNETLTAQSETIMTLRDQTLQLAAANGRGGEEAMDAAIRWSRLGLTQTQVLEAVDVSLKAANVAEISTAEAAEQLSAVFAAYRLQVGELRTVLNELNAISNVYNVTNKDLLGGLGRTSAIAKQAGLSFSELIGIIASGVGRTGRSGAEIGNAVKAIIVAISNPKIQTMLDKSFDFKVKAPSGELKDFSTTLNELYVMFQKLNSSEQGEFLQKVGGKLQASRIQALLDGYVTGQMLAIKAQRDLSSAESENEKIRATTLSQLQSLSTAFERLATNILTVGGDASLARQFTALIQLISNIIGLMANWPTFIVLVISLMAALGLKIATTMAKSTKDTGILGRTIGHVTALWQQFGVAVQTVNGELAAHNSLALKAAAIPAPNGAGVGAGAAVVGAGVAGVAGRGLVGGLARAALGTVFSPEFAVFLAVSVGIELAMKGINKLFDYFSGAAEKSADRLGEYNKELERTKALHGAADLSARLARTISDSIPSINARDPRAARQALEDFSQVAYSPEEDRNGARREALKQELIGLLSIGNVTALQNRLLEEKNRLSSQAAKYGAQEVAQKRAALQMQDQTVAELEGEIAKRKAAGKDVIEQDRKLAEARKARAETQGDITRAFTATYDGDEQPVSEDVKDFKDDTKNRFKKMGEVMDDLPFQNADHQVQKAERGIEVERQRLELLKQVGEQEKQTGEASVTAAQEKYDAAKKNYGANYQNLLAVRDEAAAMADADAKRNALRQALDHDNPYAGVGRRLAQAAFGERGETAQRQLDSLNHDFGDGAIEKAEKLKAALEDEDSKRKEAQAHQVAKTAAVEKEIKLQQEVLDNAEKQLQVAREYAELQDAISQGKRAGAQKPIQFQTGRNETEQMINEARGIGGLNGLIDQARDQRADAIFHGDKVGETRAEAEILELNNRLSDVGVKLEERRYQLARDIVNERRKETEEASKALLTAGREEQLRAALVKRFTDANGGFSANQFEFLDKGTQEAVTKFNPEAAPRELQGRSAELEAEQRTLLKNTGEVGAAIKDVTDQIRQMQLNITPAPPPAAPAVPGVAQIAAPDVNLQFAEQYQQMIEITKQTVVVALQAQISEMQDQFRAFTAGFKTAAAQSSGADSLA